MSGNIGYSITSTTYSGSWEIAPGTHWQLACKPNWRTRLAAKIFLGWIWTERKTRR